MLLDSAFNKSQSWVRILSIKHWLFSFRISVFWSKLLTVMHIIYNGSGSEYFKKLNGVKDKDLMKLNWSVINFNWIQVSSKQNKASSLPSEQMRIINCELVTHKLFCTSYCQLQLDCWITAFGPYEVTICLIHFAFVIFFLAVMIFVVEGLALMLFLKSGSLINTCRLVQLQTNAYPWIYLLMCRQLFILNVRIPLLLLHFFPVCN